jgi:hypothetical protein
MNSLEQFRTYIDMNEQTPRWETLIAALTAADKPDSILIELGTCHSFVNGGLEGCDSSDTKYWHPDQPEMWDWGAGAFSLMATRALPQATIWTVDLSLEALARCQVMTKPYANQFRYIQDDAIHFLQEFPQKADLIYLDTGYVWPPEPTATSQLEQAQVIVERQILRNEGRILLDDTNSMVPAEFGEPCPLCKSRYSLPYFLANGFEIELQKYQTLLRRKVSAPL